MMDAWFFYRQGQKNGPVEFHDLQILAANDELAPDDPVWKKGMPKWVPAKQVPKLFPQTDEPVSPPPVSIQVPQSDPLESLAAAASRSAQPTSTSQVKSQAPKSNRLVSRVLIGLGIAGVAGAAFWLGASKHRGDVVGKPAPLNIAAQAPSQEPKTAETGPSADRLAHLKTYAAYNAELKKLKVRIQNGVTYDKFCERCDAISDAYAEIDDDGSKLKQVVDGPNSPNAFLRQYRALWAMAVRQGVAPITYLTPRQLNFLVELIDLYLKYYNDVLAGTPPSKDAAEHALEP